MGSRRAVVTVLVALVMCGAVAMGMGAPASADEPEPTTTSTPGSTTTTLAPVDPGTEPAAQDSTATTIAELVEGVTYSPKVVAGPLPPPSVARPVPPAPPASPAALIVVAEPQVVEPEVEVLGVVQEPEEVPAPPVDDLSDISTGIPENIDFTPTFVVTNVGFGALMVLLLVAASQLFNDALKMHHDGLVQRLTARSAVVAGVGGAFHRLPRVHPLVTFAASAGVIALLADPSVSLSIATIGQVIGMAIGLGAIVAIYEIPAARRIERDAGVHEPFRLFPIAIVIAIGCLLFSRLFGVAPGVLYGLFAGVLFTSVDTRVAGRAYARSSILLGSAAMVAWLVHRWIEGSAPGTSPSLWAIVFDTAAAVLFVGGLQSVIVQLLPMPFTYGESVAAWSRTV